MRETRQASNRTDASAACGERSGCRSCEAIPQPLPACTLAHGLSYSEPGPDHEQPARLQGTNDPGAASGCGPRCGYRCTAPAATHGIHSGNPEQPIVSGALGPSAIGTRDAMAAAGSAAASGPGLAAPLPGAGTAPHAIVDAAEACPPSEGPVAALHLARQMLQVRRDKAAPTGAAAAAAAATESGTRPTRTLQAAGVQVPMYQTSSGVRRAVGEYRGWCGSLNVSVKVRVCLHLTYRECAV